MIEDGLGFGLVPWKPALERHLGKQVSGLAQAETALPLLRLAPPPSEPLGAFPAYLWRSCFPGLVDFSDSRRRTESR
jgi:hypothetical protein